jgi:hypothetical protein
MQSDSNSEDVYPNLNFLFDVFVTRIIDKIKYYRMQSPCDILYERLNDPGHSILVRKSYNFARYLNLTFTDLENISNLLFKKLEQNLLI